MKPLSPEFILALLFFFCFDQEAVASCDKDVFGDPAYGVAKLVREFREIQIWKFQGSEAASIQGSSESILEGLEPKRSLNPHPAATQIWYEDYLYHALLADVGGQTLLTSSPIEAQAARLVLGSPDLFAVLVQKSMAASPKIKIRNFYRLFITKMIVREMLGKTFGVSQQLRANNLLSLYSVEGQDDMSKLLRKIMQRSGVRGLVTETKDSGKFLAAMNAEFYHYVNDEVFLIRKLEFSELDTEQLRMLAHAQRFHILAYMSDRWSFPAGKINWDFLGNLSSAQPALVQLDFYVTEVARSWSPPEGIEIISKHRNIIKVSIESPSKMLALDSDLRIRKFVIEPCR